jgi:hypothetical protein
LVLQNIKNYFAFVRKNKSDYLLFNKQLVFSEIAGLVLGLIAAEASRSFTKIENSLYSGFIDYCASIGFFFIIYYYDNKKYYLDFSRSTRLIKIIKSAFSIWPSIIIADVAYVIARPYFHYVLMTHGLETGLAATVAHFLAFGVFNLIAVVSKSMIDFARK